MMMSKPSEQEDEAAPAFATPPPAALNVGSVADLERRLAEMGTQKRTQKTKDPPPPPYTAVKAPPVVAAAPPSAVKGGKNALLARIMAAKEKQQKKQAPPTTPPAPMAPPPTADLLADFDAPPAMNALPPPSYGTNFLEDIPPPAFEAMAPPPPAFDVMEQQQQQQQQQQMQFPPPPPIDSILPPPPPLLNVMPPPAMPQGDFLNMGTMPFTPTATAPMFEDLHVHQAPQEFHPPPLPPPMEAAPPQLDIDASILDALEPAEREAFLEEQRKILEQIETEKSNERASDAAIRAMSFEQRSASAVANVAASYEGGRTFLDHGGAIDAEMAQMLADAELAERLQKEEYASSEQRRNRAAEQGGSSSSSSNRESSSNQSWYEWLTGPPAPAPGTRSAPSSSQAANSSSSTPTRSNSSSGGGGFVTAQTGEESRGYGGSDSGGARVADPNKSMFSCVSDSMGTAVTQMYTFQADDEGNVHGVDKQGLLAMPDVSRQRD